MSSITFTEEMNKYNSEKKGIDTKANLGSIWYINDNPEGGLNQTFGLSDKIYYTNTKSVSSSMSHTVGVAFSVKIAFEAGIPGLANTKTETNHEVKYDFQKIDTKETSESKTESVSLTMGSTVGGIPPQSATLCTATATSGTFESPYTAQITAKLANGKTFVFKDAGKVKSVTYVDAVASCKTMPIKDMPQGTNPKKGINKTGGKRAVEFRG
ncbi:hypothetical protein CC80DRAFT_4865 [Byssothecium circinans]|uniref:Uncharacterized protein n=1 Tax=Byssothecium circinans TaxID=147558 RepID=A0A6A5UDX2_9PLEO|nr:hypothetical protein CC80DRAFT_4865 [Byssothecium circinans]